MDRRPQKVTHSWLHTVRTCFIPGLGEQTKHFASCYCSVWGIVPLLRNWVFFGVQRFVRFIYFPTQPEGKSLSAHGQAGRCQKSFKKNVFRYITKPLKPTGLLLLLKQVKVSHLTYICPYQLRQTSLSSQVKSSYLESLYRKPQRWRN